MITLFEKFKNEPDLRKIGSVIKCIKNSKHFTDGHYYKVTNLYGDPQRAIEEYGINDYCPVVCISLVEIVGDDGEKYNFRNSHYYNNASSIGDFFENFEIPEFSENMDKFNL